MPKRIVFHVTTRPDGLWQVEREGAARASALARTKAEAVNRARRIAKSWPSAQVVIHKADGRIQREYTYGQDPHPPRG